MINNHAIQSVVGDEGMHQRAASLGEILRAEDGVGRAVAIINERITNFLRATPD